MKRHAGFSMMEVLIAIGLMGVIAMFVVPKAIRSGDNSQSEAFIKEAFAVVEQTYMARQDDESLPQPAVGEPTENGAYYNFLEENLNFSSQCGDNIPSAGNTDNPLVCSEMDEDGNPMPLYKLKDGVEVLEIATCEEGEVCPGSTLNDCRDLAVCPARMEVRVLVPANVRSVDDADREALTYRIVLPLDDVTDTVRRASTQYGFYEMDSDEYNNYPENTFLNVPQ